MQQQQPMEALAAANAANVEAMRSLANTSLKATERLMNLNLGLARTSLTLGADCAQPAKNGDWRHLFSQQSNGFQKGAEEAVAYLRNVYDLSSEAQAEVNGLLSSRVDEMTDSVNSLLDVLAKSAPAGSENALAMLRSAFANGCSAYAQMVRSSQHAAAAANANASGNGQRKARRGQ